MRVTVKGQVTIPQPIRRRLGIKPGSEVAFEAEGGRVYLVKRARPADKSRLERTRGAATAGLSTKQILALTRGV